MTKATIVRIALPILIVSCALIFCLAEIARAQTTCPNAGDHPATAADLATMTTDGISNPQIGQCWNPNNFGGSAAAQAKQYLQSVACNSTIDINDLNPGFAICAQKFMQSARAQDPKICITSAYRSAAYQLQICMGMCHASSCPGTCAAPGNSYHQLGLAIDVSITTTIPRPTLWQLAQAQGLINPTGLHSSDPYHIQAPTKTSPVCNSGNAAPPAVTIKPGQSIAAAVQSLTGLPLNACTAQNYCSGNILMSQSASCSATVLQTCPYGCINGACMQQQSVAPAATAAAAPATAAATPATGATTATTATAPTSGTVTGTTPTGTTITSSGTSGAGATIIAPTLAPNTGTSSLELLDELADETANASTPTATNTPIVLNAADGEIAQLQANAPEGVTYAVPTSDYFPGSQGSNTDGSGAATDGSGNGISVTQGQGYDIGAAGGDTVTSGSGYGDTTTNTGSPPQAGVETFGSQNAQAGTGPTSAYQNNANTYGVLTLLNSLKTEVQGALAFLAVYAQPFQGNIPSQNVGE